MSYCDLVQQEGEYNYSANIQFDIENDKKLSRFIPNETTVQLLREYFVDISRAKPEHHARILYGSYGTGKSHFLTVLSLLLSKTYVDGTAYKTFLDRIKTYDNLLASDIDAFVTNYQKKPFLVVPIVFDFEDFDRCIYFSLKKKLESVGIKVRFKTFYDQALALLRQWETNKESAARLKEACKKLHISLKDLEEQLSSLDKKSEPAFQKVFSEMTFGVKYVYEVTNLEDAINQTNKAISEKYGGIVFIFDEFGRYIEDNAKHIKVKAVQNLAEFCDHCTGNNHIILVSHKEISQYTQRLSRNIANEWKKVEGRYKATPINDKQDQCLSLIRNILIKNADVWADFSNRFTIELNKIYSEAADFRGFLFDANQGVNPFEGGFPIHPIALYALDKLSKKVAQNERTFFTYLASKDPNSLYEFLLNHELNEFHFVGIDNIYDYFVPNIKSVQSDSSYECYRNLQAALAKNKSTEDDDNPEVKILKVIATIGIINDASTLAANKRTLLSVIDCPDDILNNAIEALCDRRIIKYSGSYDRYDFYEASVFDVESMLEEESRQVKDETVAQTLNEEFINFVLYPHGYNRAYKMSRVFLPVFANAGEFSDRYVLRQLGQYYDGVLIMLLADIDDDIPAIVQQINIERAIVFVNGDAREIKEAVKRYIAVKFLESRKESYVEKDPTFTKELDYFKRETAAQIYRAIDEWKNTYVEPNMVFDRGELQEDISSFSAVCGLASRIMFEKFGDALIVNNELINKNNISGSILTAKKNAISAMLSSEDPTQYYNLPHLSPDYIAVRSVLVKNGFITLDDVEENSLPDGRVPQENVAGVFTRYIEEAREKTVEFSELYRTLKSSPYGLRNGYLSMLFAYELLPARKSLIISSHGVEQELTVDLFEEIIRRPSDYAFTIASWSKEQLDFLDSLEHVFEEFIHEPMLSKNRLKAIYDGMTSHYRNVSKFARTTDHYVSKGTKVYRKLMEKSTTNYSSFLFQRLTEETENFASAIAKIKRAKVELDNARYALVSDLAASVCELFVVPANTSIKTLMLTNYKTDWQAKRNKPFDYYTNAFLDFAGKIKDKDEDYELMLRLTKALTGFEFLYWNDSHKAEFMSHLQEIKEKLDAYVVNDDLNEQETRMTLTSASGQKKSVVFDRSGMSTLGQTVKNKINATFNNYGLAISYDDKVQILLSLIEELMEGK